MILSNVEYNDDFRMVFKAPSPSSVRSKRNRYSKCTYAECKKKERKGKAKFSVCRGCKHARYCVSHSFHYNSYIAEVAHSVYGTTNLTGLRTGLFAKNFSIEM